MADGKALWMVVRMYASVSDRVGLSRRWMVELGTKVRLEVRQVVVSIEKSSGVQGSVGPEGVN
jgi:hypothetical protein